MRDAGLGFQYCIQNKGSHCSPQEGVEGGAPLPGDFRVIVCLTPPQIYDFCDLLGTPYAPVSKIAPVKINLRLTSQGLSHETSRQGTNFFTLDHHLSKPDKKCHNLSFHSLVSSDGWTIVSPSILHHCKTEVTLLVREEGNQCPRILPFFS